MKVATKFVSSLSDEHRRVLERLSEHDPTRRVRHRAQTILLSSNGSTVDEIARLIH